MLTTSTPARASSAIQRPVECEAQPPLLTCVFFGLAPPNSTISLAVPRDRGPRRERADHRLRAADDVRQERQRRAEAVVHHLIDVAAGRREEAVQLRARLVEDAGRRPALRAAHDGGVAVLAAHALDLARDQVERLVPRHRHERLAAAARAVAGTVLEPALAHHRLRDARLRMHRRREWRRSDATGRGRARTAARRRCGRPRPRRRTRPSANDCGRAWSGHCIVSLYLIASGLTGEPTAPVIGIAGATNRNS